VFKQSIFSRAIVTSIAIVCILVMLFARSLPAFAAAPSLPQWGYQGETNPQAWGKITRDFATCDLGTAQSPIDLHGAVTARSSQITFNYRSSPLNVVNNGHSIQVNYAPGSTVNIDGEEYALLQFHFHTPSEHQIAGKAATMEAHLVHRNAAGKLAVVGVMMNAGTENRSIARVWQAIPPVGETKTLDNIAIDATNLLPANKSYYSYAGSLTTPPCSEGVKWTVMTEPITISPAQIRAFAKLYPIDARPLQPTNDRKIELHGTV
jgi:carbonic anhydrase